jgi:hypothetical protein
VLVLLKVSFSLYDLGVYQDTRTRKSLHDKYKSEYEDKANKTCFSRNQIAF